MLHSSSTTTSVSRDFFMVEQLKKEIMRKIGIRIKRNQCHLLYNYISPFQTIITLKSFFFKGKDLHSRSLKQISMSTTGSIEIGERFILKYLLRGYHLYFQQDIISNLIILFCELTDVLSVISHDEVFLVVSPLISVGSASDWRDRVYDERFSFVDTRNNGRNFSQMRIRNDINWFSCLNLKIVSNHRRKLFLSE